MGDLERTVTTRFIARDETSQVIQRIGQSVMQAEPKLQLLKNNLLLMENRFTDVNISAGRVARTIRASSKDWGQFSRDIARAGRRLGFMGFILEFTLTRTLKSLTRFAGAVKDIILGASGADNALQWLERTLSSLALGGDLTAETTKRVLDTFWDMYDAGTALQSAISSLALELEPFRTVLVNVATEGLKEIRDKVREIIEDHPELIENFEKAATALKDKLVSAVVDFIENAPKILEDIEDLASFIGDFAGGAIDAAAGIVQFAKDIATFLGVEGGDFAKWIGGVVIQLIVLGKLLSIAGSIMALLGGVGGLAAGGAGAGAGAGAAAAAGAGAGAAAGGLGLGGTLAAGALITGFGYMVGKGWEEMLKNAAPWAWHEGEPGPFGKKQGFYLQDWLAGPGSVSDTGFEAGGAGGRGGQNVDIRSDVVIENLSLENLEDLNIILDAIEKGYVDAAKLLNYTSTRP